MEWEERFTSRGYQEHMPYGRGWLCGEGVEREPLGLNSGENVRMRVGPMGSLWRSRIEMGSRRRLSRSRSRPGSRSVLAPLLRRYE